MVPIQDKEFGQLKRMSISEGDWREAEGLAARIKAGEEVMIPLEVARRVLIDDEPPLRVFREWRSLSLAEPAEKTAISKEELAALDAAPALSRDAAAAIAPALGIPADLLQG